jgi:hypothetical protein
MILKKDVEKNRGFGTSPTAIRRAEKINLALEYRKLCLTYKEIAQRMGMKTPTQAWGLVRAGIDALVKEPAEDVLHIELEKLSALEKALWPQAKGGDLRAALSIQKVVKRRAAYLDLDRCVQRPRVGSMSQAELEADLLSLVKEVGLVPAVAS